MQSSSGYRSFFCRNTLKSLFSLSPLRPLSVAALLLVTALAFLFTTLALPNRAAAATYSEVMEWVEENPGPERCVQWIETYTYTIEAEESTEVRTGYRVWQRCNRFTKNIKRYIWGGVATQNNYYDMHLSACDGENIAIVPAGETYYRSYTGSSSERIVCTGETVHTTYAYDDGSPMNIYGSARGVSEDCHLLDTTYGYDCTSHDKVVAEFPDVEECYNKLTGQYEDCAQGCEDPLDIALSEAGGPGEVCGDGIDNNCNGEIDEGCSECEDVDNDGHFGYGPECTEGTDCDDSNSLVYAGTVGCEDCVDLDNDGYFGYDVFYCSLGTDCDDSDEEIYPGQGCPECVDADGDGYFGYDAIACPTGDDCDDNEKDTKPGAEEVCGDGVDNNCDLGGSSSGTVDEGCKKILQYESGNAQSALICETLLEPLIAKVEDEQGNPKGGVGVDWGVVASPAGSGGAGVSPSSTETSLGTGLTFTEMTLGNRRGAYMVDATCPDCDDGSPQTFTFEATCKPVPIHKQYDYPDEPYANICKNGKKAVPCSEQYSEPWTIREKGCALSDIAMVLDTYLGGYDPATLNTFFNYLIEDRQGRRGYDENGNVRWKAVDRMTGGQVTLGEKKEARIKYTKNGTLDIVNTKPLNNSIMDNHLERCIPVIVQVITDKPSLHWVTVEKKVGSDYSLGESGYRDKEMLSEYGGKIYAIRTYEDNYGGCR